ncbi:MAG: asparaginase domain-containing protein [Pseudonocardiaceae bacterium]
MTVLANIANTWITNILITKGSGAQDMREIFISYSHLDNQPNPHITHEVTRAVDHFLAVYSHVCDVPTGGTENELFFLDQTEIEPGQFISETIRTAIEECSVMLAFVSPRYFSSYNCFQEWKEFKRSQAVEPSGRAPKLLIPVEVKPVVPDRIAPVDELTPQWIAELVGPDGLKCSVTSKILLDRDTTRLAEQLQVLDSVIQGQILRRRGSSGGRRAAFNILTLRNKIERDSLKTRALQDELRDRAGKLKYDKLDPVCVIYAGGTVGMVHQKSSDVIHADYEMASTVDAIVQYMRPKISALPFNIHFFSLQRPIDSSNVTAEDWVNLANLVQEQMAAYQGFVILHGTNTLAYSASALSFLLSDTITKPVVLTGAEVPMSVQNTDAIHNVENAIRATAWQSYNGPMRVPEVCVYWNNQLYRGNRVAKKYASDRAEGFHTPNMPVPLATLANEKLNVNHGHIMVRSESNVASLASPRQVVNLADARVGLMFIHPEMEMSDLEAKYPNSLDGLILLSYGPGNVPEDPRFISMIERLIHNGTIVANVTQCPFGRVELKLFETSAILFDLGVIDAYDMTLEAAYTKLLWAIARRDNRKQPGVQRSIKRAFQRNVSGEMSASIDEASFGGSDTFDKAVSGGFLVSDVRRLEKFVDRYDIAEVFIRLEGVRFAEGTDSGRVIILFGKPTERHDNRLEEVNLLADFSKKLTVSEAAVGYFDKNLEVTHAFRKWFNNDEFQLSIGVDGMPSLTFSSLRLVLYTKIGRFE